VRLVAAVLWFYSVLTFVIAMIHPISRYWLLAPIAVLALLVGFYELDRRDLLKTVKKLNEKMESLPATTPAIPGVTFWDLSGGGKVEGSEVTNLYAPSADPPPGAGPDSPPSSSPSQ
jgi:hypothetical protein